MAIPTTRATEAGTIHIKPDACSGCAQCVSVCKDNSLKIVNGIVAINENPIFGCIACGHCVAICPFGAIRVEGRELSWNDFYVLPDKKLAADYTNLLALKQRRRSIREFKPAEVPKELIDKILEAAQTAPMGLPPSDVNVLVLNGREKVRKFSSDFCEYLKSIRWLSSNWFLALMRPFWGKETDQLFRNFVKPLMDVYIGSNEQGINSVTYDAPLVLYFYGSPFSDPADPIVAATYAMLAAESLGLGSVMLGAVHPMIQSGSGAKRFREAHKIKYKSREGLLLAIGYPKVHYKRGIRRTFASIMEL